MLRSCARVRLVRHDDRALVTVGVSSCSKSPFMICGELSKIWDNLREAMFEAADNLQRFWLTSRLWFRVQNFGAVSIFTIELWSLNQYDCLAIWSTRDEPCETHDVALADPDGAQPSQRAA